MERHPWDYDGDDRYRLVRTDFGSGRFGPCEVCGQRCETTWMQIHHRAYPGDEHDPDLDERGRFWCDYEADRGGFGHRDCLVGLREAATPKAV